MRLQLIGLAAALCLLGRSGVAADPQAPHPGGTVRASMEMSGYADTDHVYVASPTVAGTVGDEVAGWTLSGRYLLDAVTAASVDIVSTASSKWQERRHVGSGALTFRTSDLTVTASGGVSREPDYLSITTGLTISLDLLEKNLTPSLGIVYGQDESGRTGLPRPYWESMQKVGFQGGATFVVDRSTIASVGADAIFERGYLAKPYRYVPIFAPGVVDGVPAGASVDTVNSMRLDLRPADQLPRARDRFAITGKLAHRLETSTIRVDQRLYRDSWGLLASTTDARWMWDVGRLMLWPHGRLHLQDAVDFWERAYAARVSADGTVGLPTYRTGDRELGGLATYTIGAGAKLRLTERVHAPWSIGFQVDGIFTRYKDALYITSRRAVFSALSLEAAFE